MYNKNPFVLVWWLAAAKLSHRIHKNNHQHRFLAVSSHAGSIDRQAKSSKDLCRALCQHTYACSSYF
jgi:hypothetical protein